jgi:hypothetical protein
VPRPPWTRMPTCGAAVADQTFFSAYCARHAHARAPPRRAARRPHPGELLYGGRAGERRGGVRVVWVPELEDGRRRQAGGRCGGVRAAVGGGAERERAGEFQSKKERNGGAHV